MKNQFIPMWVLNLTPDSFSDGGQWQKNLLACDGPSWTKKVSNHFNDAIIDIGAESTAPGRVAISCEEEIKRLDQYFFSNLKLLPVTLNLSFDTYKVETIKWCLEKLKSCPQVENIYWNDVSGQYQDGVVELLKTNSKLKYILCHNKVANRSDVLNHLSYAQNSRGLNIIDAVTSFFQDALKYFENLGLSQRVILDPAFGFAKTREDNWCLVDSLPRLLAAFPQNDFLIGISRKSFLRDVGKKYQDEHQAGKTLTHEAIILGKLISCNFRQKIYWRTHHDSIVEFLKK